MNRSLPLIRLIIINALLVLTLTSAFSQATYTWNNATSDFALSTNWTPARTTPASNDILVFSDGGTYTLAGLTAQTIGKLSVSNNTKVTLQASSAATVTIAGGTDTDLSVGTGCELNLTGAAAITITAATGATAVISGNVTLAGGAHKLIGTDASSITFNSGATFTTGTGFSSNPFGTTSLNSVIFASGSSFIYIAGSNPFGASAPNSVVVFQSGSLYKHQSTNTPSFSGRTYANFELDRASTTINGSGSSALTVDNITVTQGILNLNMTSVGTIIKGNINVSSGATLTFTPSSAGNVTFSGSVSQVINSSGTLTFGPQASVILNQDIELNCPAAISATLDLKDRIISGTGALTVNNGATIRTSNAAGLTGTVLSVSSLTLSPAINYIFNGTTVQMTGEILPLSASSVTVNNPEGVTLMNILTVSSGVTLTAGNLTLGSNDLTMGTAANIVAASDRYVVVNGSGRLSMVLTDGTTKLFGFGTPTSYAGVAAVITTSGNTFTGTVGSTITHPTLHNDRLVQLQWKFEQTGTATNSGTATFMWNNAAAKGANFDITKPVVFASWDGTKYNLTQVTPFLVDGNIYGVNIGLPPTLDPEELIIGNLSAFQPDGPFLTADNTNNDVDHDIVITFTDDAVWRTAASGVSINGIALGTTDFTLAEGTLTLKPSAGNPLLTSAGSKTVAISASGYNDATIIQEILSGAVSAANSSVSAAPPMSPGLATEFMITARDSYFNPVSGYLFRAVVTVMDNDLMTDEIYTFNGIEIRSSSMFDGLPPTNNFGITPMHVVLPAVIDGGDGLSVQIKMNDGLTDVGSVESYLAPSVPNVRISAPVALNETNLNLAKINVTVSNETFADNTIAPASITLNNAPAGLSAGTVTWLTSTTAEITLGFSGTDFDADINNFSITVAGSELTLGNPLTSNTLTITAINETAPVVTTNASITTLGMNTATWGGEVTSDGGVILTQKGICWSTTNPPTISDGHTEEGSAIGPIIGDMTMLIPGTVYYVRAYAINGVGTGYGEEQSFTTLAPLEDFINFPEITSSYKDGTFLGRDGSTWNYYQCSGNDAVDITAPSPVLGKGRTPTAEVRSGQINYGVGKLSFKIAQSFTSAVNLDVYVNEYLVANVTTLATETMVVKTISNIDVYVTGVVTIKFIQHDLNAGQVTIDDISWTTYMPAAVTAEVPRFSPKTGSFLGPQDITLTSATSDAQIYYTTNGSDPTTSSTLYTAPVHLTSTATIKAVAAKAGMATSPIVTSTYNIEEITEVSTVTALRAGEPGTKVYRLTGEAILIYQQVSRNQKYVQDSGAGILIDDASGIITTTYNLYDGIKGLTGRLSLYNGVIQFTPVFNPGAASSTGNTVTPVTVTVSELNTNYNTYESRLIKVSGVTFSSTGNFAASTNYNFSDGTNTSVFRSAFSTADYIGQAIPAGKVNITGIGMEFNGTAQIASRNLADIYVLSTDKAITSFVFNGLSPAVTATINEAAKTISATVPASTNRTALVPTIAISNKATINPVSGLAKDFTGPVTYTVTAEDGTTAQYTVTVSLATGIEDQLSGRFRVYPVPARTEIYADGIEDVTLIEVFDVTGNKHITEKCDGESLKEIPIGHLARGIYFIRLTTQQGSVMKKFVKE